MKRSHSWFTDPSKVTWAASPGRSLLCLIPGGSGADSVNFVEEWVKSNIILPDIARNLSPLLIRIVPDQSTSAVKFVRRISRVVERKANIISDCDGSEDPSEMLEDLIEAIHECNKYPILIIERFQSFAQIADDAVIAVLSQLRSLENRDAITTIAFSSRTYADIRRSIPRGMAFVNSSYGDDHRILAMKPISYEEFAHGSAIVSDVLKGLFAKCGGPDFVYKTILDEFERGSDGIDQRCLIKSEESIVGVIEDLGFDYPVVMRLLEKAYEISLSDAEAAYLSAMELSPFITSDLGQGRLGLKGPFVSSVVENLIKKDIKMTAAQERSINVLVVAANPDQDLDLEREVQSIRDLVDASRFRDSTTVNCVFAVTPGSFLSAIRKFRPNVVHFSGHGDESGVVMRDDEAGVHIVKGKALKSTLMSRGVDLVVLNSCYSADIAMELSGVVRAVVGTTDELQDDAAKRFSKAFYRTLFDGHTVGESMQDGQNSVELYDCPNVYYTTGDISITLTA